MNENEIEKGGECVLEACIVFMDVFVCMLLALRFFLSQPVLRICTQGKMSVLNISVSHLKSLSVLVPFAYSEPKLC